MRQFLIALDQLLNTLCGGMADETISARAWRSGWTRREAVINWVFRDTKHCENAFLAEQLRGQLPTEYQSSFTHESM